MRPPRPPKPPAHLSAEASALWSEVLREYRLAPESLLLLRTACEQWDRAQQAREAIARDGLLISGRAHPAVNVEKQAYGMFLRAVRQLGLDIVEPGGQHRVGR